MSHPNIVASHVGPRGGSSRPAGVPPRRPGGLGLLIPVLVLLPVLEVAVLVATGRLIGLWWTLGLLIVVSALGAWLMKSQGRSAWLRLRDAARSGQAPTTEVADAALILLAGALLVLPGVLSDIVALFLLVPFTRRVARRSLQRGVERRVREQVGVVRSVVVDSASRRARGDAPIILPHQDLRPRD